MAWHAPTTTSWQRGNQEQIRHTLVMPEACASSGAMTCVSQSKFKDPAILSFHPLEANASYGAGVEPSVNRDPKTLITAMAEAFASC